MLFLVPQIKAPKLMMEEGLMVNLEYTAFTENLIGILAMISPSGRAGSIIWQRRMGWDSILTSFLARKNTCTVVGLSIEVSVPLLGWIQIMELKFVGKIPKESTVKLNTISYFPRFFS